MLGLQVVDWARCSECGLFSGRGVRYAGFSLGKTIGMRVVHWVGVLFAVCWARCSVRWLLIGRGFRYESHSLGDRSSVHGLFVR